MTLKEYFDKARDEDGKLLVRFVKITDNTERTVVFSNAADVDATFDNSVEVSHRILKTIKIVFIVPQMERIGSGEDFILNKLLKYSTMEKLFGKMMEHLILV